MNSTLNPDTVLSLNPHCSVRAQEKQVVIYNSKTDELHFGSVASLLHRTTV